MPVYIPAENIIKNSPGALHVHCCFSCSKIKAICPLFMCKLMSMHAIENRQSLNKNNAMAAVSSLLQHMARTHIPDSAVVDLLMLLTKGHILAYGIAVGASFIVVGKRHVNDIDQERYCCIIHCIDDAGTTCIAHAGTRNSTLQFSFGVGTAPHRARAWHEFYHAPDEKNIVQACLGICDSE